MQMDEQISEVSNYYAVANPENGERGIYRTAPLLRPPPFATYFQEKEGGGRNNEDLRFRLAVKPPPSTNSHTL